MNTHKKHRRKNNFIDADFVSNRFTDKLITIKVPSITYTTELKKYNSQNQIK